MLSDAIREIEVRTREDTWERTRRAAVRAHLRRAEAYAHQIEELLLTRQRCVPVELSSEIRLFVGEHSPGSAASMSERGWAHCPSVLDLLWDLQERMQNEVFAIAGMLPAASGEALLDEAEDEPDQ